MKVAASRAPNAVWAGLGAVVGAGPSGWPVEAVAAWVSVGVGGVGVGGAMLTMVGGAGAWVDRVRAWAQVLGG